MSERAKSIVYPLIALVLFGIAWTLSIRLFDIPGYILPSIGDVGSALHRGYVQGAYWEHFRFTLASMVFGYAAGCGAAFVLGCLFAEFRVIERVLYPYVLALQSMPKVALAPLILVWFGFDMASKVVMVALVCFFPMFINTAVGLKSASEPLLDLMKAFSASRWHVLTRIKIPSAAGHIFAGLQISVVLGLIGAVVAEFVSSTKGLGYLINSATVTLDTGTMFAALVSLALLGIVGSQVVKWLHRRVVFWDRSGGATTLSD